eukprot:CAMPEP_0113640486 /NCGR_PEP_ID=MMETSP0017_2-20120614/21249_1 /TAXON_ID=2856 /ORGANISM="Cylindrotheca closterium" /LENGTH=83 /DNA_ID=CAMNT_0000551771 /DNA_START=1971 /DNA_END=2222 /DNA_ORIENTATION=- /assembly_acc=CAM_ASM_000147
MASSDLQRQRNYVPERNLKYHPFKKAVRNKECRSKRSIPKINWRKSEPRPSMLTVLSTFENYRSIGNDFLLPSFASPQEGVWE